jgi:hypothetical protein
MILHRRKPWRLPSGKLAAWYLYRELGEPLNFPRFWRIIVAACRRERWLYQQMYLPKKNGKLRLILIPCPELKLIQKAIDHKILATFDRHPNAFGFSGGSVREALTPIVHADQPIFCADLKDAFPETSKESVFKFFRKNRFGFNSSYFLAHLTTWTYAAKSRRQKGKARYRFARLPQGAPSSPRLFDLCFEPVDKKLAKFMVKIGGVYARYADNLFFAFPTAWPEMIAEEKMSVKEQSVEFGGIVDVIKTVFVNYPEGTMRVDKTDYGATVWHSPAISAIYQIVANRHQKNRVRFRSPSFRLHKAYLAEKGQILHALGLNLIDGQLHNKREFKHRLRLVLYNLQKALDAHDDFETKVWPLYQQANGMEQFAIKETLPAKLVQDCDDLLLRVFNIRYSGSSGTWVKDPQY